MHNTKIVRFRRVGDIFDSTLLPDLPVFKLNSECRVLRPRNLVKKISNPAKKITGSGRCPSLTGNKLLGFKLRLVTADFLGALTD